MKFEEFGQTFRESEMADNFFTIFLQIVLEML